MKKSLNEQIGRMKQMMNLKEDDSQAMIQQYTEEFNEKVDEDLTTDEFEEVACTNADSVEIPEEVDTSNEEKQKFDQFKQKLKTATISQLMQVKKQIKELRKQSKQQNEQAGAMVTLLGVTMPHTFALIIGGLLLLMVLNILMSLTGVGLVRTITNWCSGRTTTGYGLRFGRRN